MPRRAPSACRWARVRRSPQTVYAHLFDEDMDDVASRLEASIAERVRPGRGLAIIEGGAVEVRRGL